MIYSIKQVSLSKLNNQEFAAYAINVQKLITEKTGTALGLDPKLVTELNDTLRLLTDRVYEATTASSTADMKAADDKRCVIYRRIRHKLGVVDMVEDGSSLQKIADKVRIELLNKYTSRVPSLPQQERSAVLQGFLFDLHSKLDDDDVELLGIEGDITRLEQANNAFLEHHQSRLNEKADSESDKTLRLRQDLTEIFAHMAITLEYWANSTSESDAAKTAECQTFIRLQNVLLSEVQSRYLQRRKHTADGSDDQNPDDNGSTAPDVDGTGSTDGSTTPDAGNKPSTGGQTTPDAGNGGQTGGNTGSTGNGNVTDF